MLFVYLSEGGGSSAQSHRATLHHLGHKDDLVAFLPHGGLERLTREHMARETHLDVRERTKGTEHVLSSDTKRA